MVDSFYERHMFEEKFDCIVSRFNLEHILDLNEFMEKIKTDLKPSCLLFIQVPNSQNFLSNGIINIFAHEHAHYFCEARSQLYSKVTISISFASRRPRMIPA